MLLFKDIFLHLFLILLPSYVSAALVSRDSDGNPDWIYHWSGAWRYTESVETLDQQLPSLARQGYEDMVADAQSKNIDPTKIPNVMTAMAVDSDVYFSSSLKGGSYLVWPKRAEYVDPNTAKEVAAAIDRCQRENNKSGHKYRANCGEPIAAQQFCRNNPDTPLNGKGRVSTYGIFNQAGDKGILDPCWKTDDKGPWGCAQFVAALNLQKKGNQWDTPDLPTINAPTQSLPHCFWS